MLYHPNNIIDLMRRRLMGPRPNQRRYPLHRCRGDIKALLQQVLMLVCLVPISLQATELNNGPHPRPFKVIYKADYKGLPISATGIREFTLVEAEGEQPLYTLSSSALSIFAKLEEQSDFTLTDTSARPLFYRYDRTGLGKNKNLRLNFDWTKSLLINPDTEVSWPLTAPNISDRLLYQFQLQIDLLNTGPTINLGTTYRYNVQDEGTLKLYEFTVLAETDLSTPLGSIRTYEVIRSNDRPGRKTRLFLAPDLEFMLIRFEQTDDEGEGFSLMLEKAFIEDSAITASSRSDPKP